MLKTQGKKLFVCTNKHIDYVELTLGVTLGNDWKEIFDLVLVDCKKSLFFRNTDTGFYNYNQAALDYVGE